LVSSSDQFKDGDSSDLFKAGKSSAFKMADCPFYSQAQLAYKEGPLLKERGCEVERVSLKGKRESFFTFVSLC
jgi:hypothetical protein